MTAPVSDTEGPESGLDRLDSVSVRVDELVKDGAKRRRLRRSTILDKFINTNRNAVHAIKAAFSAFQTNPM
jgi:hypothetical protein